MQRVPFDRFLRDLADRDVYPDPSHIQNQDVAAIWEDLPARTRRSYLDDIGLGADEATARLVGAEVVFEGPGASAGPAETPSEEAPPAAAGDATRAEADPPGAALGAAASIDPAEAGEDQPLEVEPEELHAPPPPVPPRGPRIPGREHETVAAAEPVEVEPVDDIEAAEAVPVEPMEEIEELAGDALEEVADDEPADSVSEVEVYPVYEPYAYVRISYDEDDHQYLYEVIEPELSERETKILEFIQETIVDVLDVGLSRLTEEEAEEMLVDLTEEVIEDYSIELDENTRLRLTYYIVRDFLGYDKLDVIMRDPMIEDINCDGVGVPIFLYHRKYESMASTVVFEEHEELDSFVIKLAQRSGKHISIADPLLDARLPDGSRLNATLSDEVTTKGSTFTIRKFRDEPFTPPDLIRFGTMSDEMLAYYWMAIQHGASVIVAGGTASGKTTLLNAVMLFIPPQMKIVSIEDTRELSLPHPNWIPGTTRSGFGQRDEKGRQSGEIDMFQLLKAALRQRPEYITVGEVRGEEATVLFQAMATGHAAYGTMHADSVTSVIHRLEGEPINIPRPLLEALDIVTIQIQTRTGGQRVRRTQQIVEIVGMDPNTKELLTNEVFNWDPADDTFEHSGISYVLERIQKEENLTEQELQKEVENRTLIIEWMQQQDVRDYVDVAKVVQSYYTEPEETVRKIRLDLGIEAPEDPEEVVTLEADLLDEDRETEDDEDEGFDSTADLPAPDDEAAVSPLSDAEREDMERLDEGFDPVEAADAGDDEDVEDTEE